MPDGDTGTCSETTSADGTTQECPLKARQVLTLEWEVEQGWCSEESPIKGTTKNYPDGEKLTITLVDKTPGESMQDLPATISANAFREQWKMLDILPPGTKETGWKESQLVDGRIADHNIETPKPLSLQFIPNVAQAKVDHSLTYKRMEDGSEKSYTMTPKFELKVENYLLTIIGQIKYVKGHGVYVLRLGKPSGDKEYYDGAFAIKGWDEDGKYVDMWVHWGEQLPDRTFRYHDGTQWQPLPATFDFGLSSNRWGVAFYKDGSNWVCRDYPGKMFPGGLSDWDEATNSKAVEVLAEWEEQIARIWSKRHDIKRKACESTKVECCRYEIACKVKFIEDTETFNASRNIIVGPGRYRSDVESWSLTLSRAMSPGDASLNTKLTASHEFGHMLAIPDEYAGAATTQTGRSSDEYGDAMVDGVDSNCLMGDSYNDVIRRRHYRAIVEGLSKMVKDQRGKEYEYIAVDVDTTLASPEGTPLDHSGSQASGGGGAGGVIAGAIIGAVVGAVAGAIIGFIVSGGNPAGAAAGAAAGAVAGALAGAALGSLF